MIPFIILFLPKATPILLGGVAYLGLKQLLRGHTAVHPPPATLWGLLVLLIWTWLSVIWSIDSVRSADIALQVSGSLAMLWLAYLALPMINADLREFSRTLLKGGIIGLGIVGGFLIACWVIWTKIINPFFLSEIFFLIAGWNFLIYSLNSDFLVLWPSTFRVILTIGPNRASCALALFTPILLMCLFERSLPVRYRWGAFMSLSFLSTAILLLSSNSAKLALLVGIITTFTALWKQRFATGCIMVALVAIGALMPTISHYLNYELLPRSDIEMAQRERAAAWSFVAEKARLQPWTGWGAATSRRIPGAQDQLTLAFDVYFKPEGKEELARFIAPASTTLLGFYPHNAFLEWRAELGSIGLALIVSFILWILHLARQSPSKLEGAAKIGSISVAVTVYALNYSVWQAWWHASMALTVLVYLYLSPLWSRPSAATKVPLPNMPT